MLTLNLVWYRLVSVCSCWVSVTICAVLAFFCGAKIGVVFRNGVVTLVAMMRCIFWLLSSGAYWRSVVMAFRLLSVFVDLLVLMIMSWVFLSIAAVMSLFVLVVVAAIGLLWLLVRLRLDVVVISIIVWLPSRCQFVSMVVLSGLVMLLYWLVLLKQSSRFLLLLAIGTVLVF